jgi:hypothetical protein
MAEKKTEKPIEKMAEKKKPEVKEVIAEKKSDIVSLFKNGVTILRHENDVQKYLQDGWVVK